ncbi:MAG: hypothetical protein H6766_06505 [Candidatus Peribacteria bacterium]|nr:MAG: hypothetical protein H6766_06505 [Candidatus Peribacteria bacterium]
MAIDEPSKITTSMIYHEKEDQSDDPIALYSNTIVSAKKKPLNGLRNTIRSDQIGIRKRNHHYKPLPLLIILYNTMTYKNLLLERKVQEDTITTCEESGLLQFVGNDTAHFIMKDLD